MAVRTSGDGIGSLPKLCSSTQARHCSSRASKPKPKWFLNAASSDRVAFRSQRNERNLARRSGVAAEPARYSIREHDCAELGEHREAIVIDQGPLQLAHCKAVNLEKNSRAFRVVPLCMATFILRRSCSRASQLESDDSAPLNPNWSQWEESDPLRVSSKYNTKPDRRHRASSIGRKRGTSVVRVSKRAGRPKQRQSIVPVSATICP